MFAVHIIDDMRVRHLGFIGKLIREQPATLSGYDIYELNDTHKYMQIRANDMYDKICKDIEGNQIQAEEFMVPLVNSYDKMLGSFYKDFNESSDEDAVGNYLRLVGWLADRASSLKIRLGVQIDIGFLHLEWIKY